MMDSSDESTNGDASTGGSASSGEGFGAVARYVIMEVEEEALGEERNGRFWKTQKRQKKVLVSPPPPPKEEHLIAKGPMSVS